MTAAERPERKTWGVHCAVAWCVCLATVENPYCAVHAVKGRTYRPGDGPVPGECDACGGTQECQDCDGTGFHECDHRNCWHEHECPTCDGTGDCHTCVATTRREVASFEARYLAFAFDPGWVPPVLITHPWEEGDNEPMNEPDDVRGGQR